MLEKVELKYKIGMKVNLNVPFVDFMGQPIIDKDENGVENQTIIGEFMAKNLFTMVKMDGKALDPDQMLMAYRLAKKLVDTPEAVELSAKEISFLEDVGSKTLVVGCYGQLYDLLEGNNV